MAAVDRLQFCSGAAMIQGRGRNEIACRHLIFLPRMVYIVPQVPFSCEQPWLVPVGMLPWLYLGQCRVTVFVVQRR